MNVRRYTLSVLLLLTGLCASAQEFFNLTASEVRIDSVLPLFTYTRELGAGYADSTYTVTIEYPEFIDMSETDVARLHKITDRKLPPMPEIQQYIGVSRKRGTLYVAFTPIVFREGKYQKLVSFMIKTQQTHPRPLPTGRGCGWVFLYLLPGAGPKSACRSRASTSLPAIWCVARVSLI